MAAPKVAVKVVVRAAAVAGAVAVAGAENALAPGNNANAWTRKAPPWELIRLCLLLHQVR